MARSPRLSIALPEGLMKALERWAKMEGNKPTSLATFLLEKIIREAIEEGKIPPEPKEETQGNEEIITLLENGASDIAIAELCHDLMLPEGTEERLQALLDKLSNGKEKKVNGSKH